MARADGDITPMDEAAVAMHEVYLAFRRAGFTRTEALTVVTKLASDAMNNASEEGRDDNGER